MSDMQFSFWCAFGYTAIGVLGIGLWLLFAGLYAALRVPSPQRSR